MKITEITKTVSSKLLKDQSAREWVINNTNLSDTDRIVAVGDAVSVLKGGVTFYAGGIEELPVQFKVVSDYFDATGIGLKTLKGLPSVISAHDGWVSVANNEDLTSLAGITEKAYEINLGGCTGITSLKGIENQIKHAYKLYIPHTVKSHLLGVTLIENLRFLYIGKDQDGIDQASDDLKRAVNIIDKYVGEGKAGMMKAQRELLDADLDDFAEM